MRKWTLLLTTLWFLLFASILFQAVRFSLSVYPKLWGMDLEAKQRLLDDDLFAAAKACERHLPINASLFFYNSPHVPRRLFTRHSPNFFLSHDQQKMAYLLYPRRVYWEGNWPEESVDYLLVYHAPFEEEGFEPLVRLSEDVVLLKRRRP